MNKILRLNMASLTQVLEEPKKEYQLLGGRAFIARFMLDEVNPVCEPLGHHNKLIYTPGLLGGSKVFSSGRISIGAKSPLTGGIKESNGGGVVGLKLGRLGYKAIVVEDVPLDDKKYIIKITREGAEFLPADDYWGLRVYDTAKRLRKKFGQDVAVSCIGPTGEMKFLSAGIANTDLDGVPSRYCGRGGLGAVMGSKGIKALIIDDSAAIVQHPIDDKAFTKVMKEYARILNESPVVEAYRVYGTAAMVQVTNAVGGLPTRNFSTGRFEGADKISGETMHDIIVSRKGEPTHVCMPGCLIRCSNIYKDEQGETIVAPLEYETIALMGSNLAIDNLDVIAQLNFLCNDYGLDTIETGAALGVAMAAGIIPFGDCKGAINLVDEIGKGSLIGRILGMGTQTAGKVLGVLNLPIAKGQAMPGYEPRGIKGIGVTYATSPMGADHTAGATARAQVNHNSREGQAALSKKMQYTVPIYDYLGLCMFVSAALGPYPEILAQLVNAQIGTDYDPEELFKLAKNTVQWEREFNRRAGFTNLDDRLPEYFNETPNPATGTTFDVADEELDQVHDLS
jgi:aldehyde:ferredoxin oxidoreductase